jgi:hypothetical protein
MQQHAESLETARQVRDHHRQPLYGEGTGGAAFAGYTEALALAKALGNDQTTLVAMLPHRDDGKVAGTENLRERWRPALAALRAAAHCTDARPPRPAPTQPGHGILNLLTVRWLVNMAVLESRACRLAGDHAEAVAWSLDAAAMAADLTRDGLLINQMIAIAAVQIATVEAWPEHALRQLDAPALERLATGLERLDAALPQAVDWHSELAFFWAWLQSPHEPGDEQWLTRSWRYGFSMRWMVADAYLQMTTTYDRLAAAVRSPWPQREALMQAEIAALVPTSNPALSCMVPNLTSAEQNLREVVAQVRMLRMAIALHRGLDAAALPDPLGDGALEVVPDANGVTFRSAGSTSERPIERHVAR